MLVKPDPRQTVWHDAVVARSDESFRRPVRAASSVRVCIVAPSLRILGGQAVQAARLIERLSTLETVEIAHIPINPRLPFPLRWLQSIKYVRTAVTTFLYVGTLLAKLHKYDVVHVFSASYWSFLLAPLPAVLVARLFGKQVLLNYHSGEARDHLNRWGWIAVPAIRLAHRVIVPSQYLVDVFSEFDVHAKSISNFVGVDAIAHRARQSLAPSFISNRNFETHYNVPCVLRAFATIQSKYPDARLLVVGEGSQGTSLKELASSLRLRNVKFVGAIAPRDMGRYLNIADVYLNGSNIDNMPLSILEAFATGVPVVSTNAGGIPYIVSHERNGLLVPRNDHEALAREALRLLEDPDLVAKITSAAHAEYLERYTWSAVQRQWERCYLDLAARPAEARSLA